MDEVWIPEDLEPGAYTLSFRSSLLKKKRLHEMGIQDEQQIYQEKIKSKS